jgi:transglutaminase-like putative cysteine protease
VSPQVIRLRPAPHSRTQIKGYTLKIKPENHSINWQQDPFGNYLARIVFPEKINHFEVVVEVIADMVVINPFDFFIEEYAFKPGFQYEKGLKQQLIPYLEITDSDPLMLELVNEAKKLHREDMNTTDYLVAINTLINKKLSYNIRMEPGVQSCAETLTLKSGSCRDFTWVLVQLLRHLGYAARFTSGYLVQLKADTKSLDGPSGPENDFTDLHAWAEVYIPDTGWVEFDSTNNLLVNNQHIRVATGRDFADVVPMKGIVYSGCGQKMLVTVDVQRIG